MLPRCVASTVGNDEYIIEPARADSTGTRKVRRGDLSTESLANAFGPEALPRAGHGLLQERTILKRSTTSRRRWLKILDNESIQLPGLFAAGTRLTRFHISVFVLVPAPNGRAATWDRYIQTKDYPKRRLCTHVRCASDLAADTHSPHAAAGVRSGSEEYAQKALR
jgi:hypothetical protein